MLLLKSEPEHRHRDSVFSFASSVAHSTPGTARTAGAKVPDLCDERCLGRYSADVADCDGHATRAAAPAAATPAAATRSAEASRRRARTRDASRLSRLPRATLASFLTVSGRE